MKTGKERYDVFISYRREGGEETAKHLRDVLTERGYKVFLDVESLRNGPFNEALNQVIENAKDFLLILPQNALDRCVNENDWVRIEIEHAKACCKNIIPIMLKGFTFPKELPESIDFIRYQNAPPTFDVTFFDAFVDRLQTFMVSKRKSRLKRAIAIVLACVLLFAAGYGIYYFKNTYPLTTKDQNLVSELITYLSSNLKQVDLSGDLYLKGVNHAMQFVEGKTTDTEATLQYELTSYCTQLGKYRASLTDIPDQLKQDLKGDKHFVLGDLDAFKPNLYNIIDSYINSLQYIRDNVVSENGIRSETHIAYLTMLQETANLDGEILFYNLNELLLSVTNQKALDSLKNKLLPDMPFIYAKRLDLTNDKEALHGKQEAAYTKYNKLLENYEEALQKEEDYDDSDETLRSIDMLISLRESHGLDATELIELRESIQTKIQRIEEEKKAVVDAQIELEKLKQEAYEKFKPSEDDDIGDLWGKGKRFLTIDMPEAAIECYNIFIEKTDGNNRYIGTVAKRFAEICTSLEIRGGVVVCAYLGDEPHQAVELFDIIYEVDGNLIRNCNQYNAAIAESGVHDIKLIRFNSTSYEIIESKIDTNLGELGLNGLNDEKLD